MLTVAIIGRPNVGKSTLFNRLVGKRVAITLKEPGTTRDRIIQPAEWLGRHFWVIDTGGLIPASAEIIPKEVEAQAELAIQEADLVLLLTDGRAGLHPVDTEIARHLQRRNKPFLLVVNKVDTSESAYDLSEFYKLGVKEFFPVSAEHGRNIDLVLERIFALYPETETALPEADIRLVILGRPNVGKSSLLNSLLGSYRSIVTEIPGTTRDAVEATFRYQERNYLIVDTAGIRRKSRVAEALEYFSVIRAVRNIAEADIALLVLDIREGMTMQDKHIAALVAERNKGLVIVANKADLVKREAIKPIQDWLRSSIPYIRHVPIVFTSAKTGTGISQVLDQAEKVFTLGALRLTGAQLKEQLLPVLQANPPPDGAQILGIRQKGVRPPDFILYARASKNIPESYLRYVEREIRRRYPFTGYPLRVRVSARR